MNSLELCRRKGKRLPKRENGRKVLVLSFVVLVYLVISRVQRFILVINSPHVSCQLLPALEAVVSTCCSLAHFAVAHAHPSA